MSQLQQRTSLDGCFSNILEQLKVFFEREKRRSDNLDCAVHGKMQG